VIVISTDRLGTGSKSSRLWCSEGEQVPNRQRAEAPCPREADTASDRRVIGRLVGRGRIEHDEEHLRARVPATPERESITTAKRELSQCFHRALSSDGESQPSAVEMELVSITDTVALNPVVPGMALAAGVQID
jgi:hypothetical protein